MLTSKRKAVAEPNQLAALEAQIAELHEIELSDHHSCRLGKWYYGDASKTFRSKRAFTELEAPHAAVHAHGKEAARLFASGKLDQALQEIAEVESASRQVVDLLGDLAKD